ncbi:hypothetical protein BLNAU_6096 [Blattamonas nauphoetae]|uniref:Uncharacterized protein n=1 Tax=Blattamonas nauphoetae TaxID=2049346 RepID=A0ABQ9Y524_9EUKA|nr:hypothetical protein BLNAU_6096 [Blattamonas nauphoetae]
MLISLFVVFTYICSTSINLQDVLNKYDDDTKEITLNDEEYFGIGISIKDRDLSLIGRLDSVSLTAEHSYQPVFILDESSLTVISISIKPSQHRAFAFATEDSILNLTYCKYDIDEAVFPILQGYRCRLVVSNMSFNDMNFTRSLIERLPEDDTDLSIIVQHSSFDYINILSQNPLLAGPEVLNVTVINTTFSRIECLNDGRLPAEPIEGTADREVSLEKTKIEKVDGALSGALVFGMQASKLSLLEVTIEDSENAVRHSDNVAFASKSEVMVRKCTTKNTKTTEIWPNGGFLFLPHDKSSLTISLTDSANSSAPNGNGGWVFVSGHSKLNFNSVSSDSTSAGKCGGFVFAGGSIEELDFSYVEVSNSKAGENGGGVFVSRAEEIDIDNGVFCRCESSESGGAVFVDVADNTKTKFTKVTFTSNEAVMGYGHDVLFSYLDTTTYYVSKADFKKCKSSVTVNGVYLLPFHVGTEWSNTYGQLTQTVIICAVAGGSVLLVLGILLPCICCCCGCCAACGCGRKRTNTKYQHIPAQPQHPYASPPAYQPHYTPQPPISYPPNPLHYACVQPVPQPPQFEQYPLVPAHEVGVDQSINKIT